MTRLNRCAWFYIKSLARTSTSRPDLVDGSLDDIARTAAAAAGLPLRAQRWHRRWAVRSVRVVQRILQSASSAPALVTMVAGGLDQSPMESTIVTHPVCILACATCAGEGRGGGGGG